MKRLNENNINTPEEYDRIYYDRKDKGEHWQDTRRWGELIKYFKGGYIVDVGCLDSKIWDMVHTKFSEKLNYRYLGTDVAEDCIKEMGLKHPYSTSDGEPLCGFLVDDIYNSKIKEGIVDYVVLGEVLEHQETPGIVIDNVFKLLKPGGTLAISVPLNEAKEIGAVDGDRHLWSFDKEDINYLIKPYSNKVRFKVLRSKWFPYKYCWPQLICWADKR